MSIDQRTPVIVGVGQHVHRSADLDDALEPVDLMVAAIRAAAADAGLADVPAPDSIRVVSLLSWRYGDPAAVLAERLGVTPRELAYTAHGGNVPQTLVNLTARQLAAGEMDVVILTGGEATRTRTRAKQAGRELDWSPAADSTPTMLGGDLPMNMPEELERGIVLPVQVYPMFESAIRADAGRDVETHQRLISELWARFSAVAADNPNAWIREARTAEEIRTPSESNRMIGTPYPKLMNSNNQVDMSAAVIMCTAEAATRLGVPTDRWVFPLAGADCHEHAFISHRDTFARTPAVELGGRMVLDLAATTIDEIEVIDLYSCFPSAVQLGARSLGLDPYDPDRQLTRTGGLSFAGGPWNNYVMHAIATVVDDLRRRPGERGLVWGNGGYATKHAFGVYGTEPPKDGFRHGSPQAEVDALPARTLASPADATGPATIEAFTVMHDREGRPEQAIATCLLADGRRAWGTSADTTLAKALTEGEWVGCAVQLRGDGTLELD